MRKFMIVIATMITLIIVLSVPTFAERTSSEPVWENGMLISSGTLLKVDENLEVVRIPEGVTNISIEAFDDADCLKKVFLPKSLDKINYGTFEKLDKDVVVYYPDNIESFVERTNFDWDFLQLITTDLYYNLMKIFAVILLFMVVYSAILLYNTYRKNKEEREVSDNGKE